MHKLHECHLNGKIRATGRGSCTGPAPIRGHRLYKPSLHHKGKVRKKRKRKKITNVSFRQVCVSQRFLMLVFSSFFFFSTVFTATYGEKKEKLYVGRCKGRSPVPNRLFFFNIVQTAFDPPPSFLNIYVADYIADYSAKQRPEVYKICNKNY